MAVTSTGYIRVTHTGVSPATIYIKDLDGEVNRKPHEKVPVYVGAGNSIDILLNDRTVSSFAQGDIRTFVDLGYITAVIIREDTRIFHVPTITPSDSEVSPGLGPTPVVFGTIIGLHYDNSTDASYRIFKIPSNFVGNPSFHIHWTKSGNLNESGHTVRWQLAYTVFNGSSDEVALVSPTILTLDDTYEDSGTTSKIIYRTANAAATGFVANYYVGLSLTYVAANTNISGGPVVVSADLLWEGTINQGT